ncbi:hypothetical protein DIPPA_14422 [Diplonema papillatum]|nr:hypothetical protein DIPPA_14422 [Diplonema papillatum]
MLSWIPCATTTRHDSVPPPASLPTSACDPGGMNAPADDIGEEASTRAVAAAEVGGGAPLDLLPLFFSEVQILSAWLCWWWGLLGVLGTAASMEDKSSWLRAARPM